VEGVPCPTNKGVSYTNLVYSLVVTLKLDYYYYEDLVLDDLPLDVDLTSRKSCMRDDEEEVGELTHEPLMELILSHSSSF
jgi:hypothetical protein